MTIRHSQGSNPAIARAGTIAIAAALLLAMLEPSVAARKLRKPADSGSTQRSDQTQIPAYDPHGTSRQPFGPGRNFPYPDRPYGDPGRW
jgi:hypothetical protein